MTGRYILSILFPLLLLLGCISETKEVSGGDNFPNGVEPLGKAAAANLKDTADWDSIHRFPAHPGEAYNIPVPKTPAEYATDSGFAVNHAVRGDTLLQIYTLDSPGLYISDTLFLPVGSDSNAPPDTVIRISGLTEDRNSGVDSAYTYSAQSGDGLLFPSRASYTLIADVYLQNLDKSSSQKHIRLNTGPDGDPATSVDNKLLAFSFTEADAAGNLRLQYTLLDGDSNQSVIDFSSDSNAVILESRFNGQTGDWEAAQWFLRQGLMLSSDSARLFSYYSQGSDASTGESKTQEITTTGGRAVFQPGDSVEIKKTVVFAADDSLETRENIYRTLYQPPGVGINGLPFESEVKTFIRRGPVYKEVLQASFHSSGDSAHTEFKFCRIFADLSWLTFKGAETADGFQGTLFSSQGDSLSVEFDASGVLLMGTDP